MQKTRKSTRRLTPFGIAVKKILLERGMTQRELAKEIGTSGQYLNLVFHGERARSIYVDRIVQYLEMEKIS